MAQEAAGRFERPALIALRVVAGTLFALHGTQRLLGWPPGGRATEGLRIASSAIELVTGALIALGIAVPWAAGIAALTMIAGVALRRTEIVALYAVIWTYVAARG
jgi:putative oxidoreductase